MSKSERELIVTGMTCAACVRRVEKTLERVPGVESVFVNLATSRATLTGPATDLSDAIAALEKAGYGGREYQSGVLHATSQQKPHWIGFLISGGSVATALVVMALSMIGEAHSLGRWILIASLTALVVFGSGGKMLLAGARAMLAGSPTMDSLVGIGAMTSFIYSVVILSQHAAMGHDIPHAMLYFDSAAMIVSLVGLGKFLETRARSRAGSAIEHLMQLAPDSAALVTSESTETVVPISMLKIGDVVRARPGDRIAVDGIVISGTTSIDQSMLTGESAPVQMECGDRVFAGTLNQAGSIDYRAEMLGDATMLANIIRITERAQGSRAPIQRLADRISAIFVPAVLLLAIGTLLVSIWALKLPLDEAIMRAVAVVVVACPCALGLATPIAVMVASGRGAELGLLIKSGETIEALVGINVLVCDKTGTLTEGRPRVTSISPKAGISDHDLLQWAASAEHFSEHPIARSIVDAARDREIGLSEVEDFQSQPGMGVSARVAGDLIEVMRPEEHDSEHTVAVVRGGEVVGYIDVEDPLRESSIAAVGALQRLGIKVVIASGDRPGVVRRIAERAGVDQFHGDMLPDQKQQLVQDLQRNGSRVAMAGDGINDAPALAQAEVGIAMGSGTKIAQEVGSIVLLRSDLAGIEQAVRLSKAAMRTIRINLGWAFGYNALLIPMAMVGRLDPMLAAGAMAISSLTVVLNSLLLNRFR